jgi:hypothetical protein
MQQNHPVFKSHCLKNPAGQHRELISKLRREHDFYVFGKQIFTFKRMSIPAGSVIELKIKIGR